MFRALYNLVEQLMLLTHKTRQYEADIKTLKQEIQHLNITVHRLAQEIAHIKESEQYEREAITLRLQNTLLQFERRLPPTN